MINCMEALFYIFCASLAIVISNYLLIEDYTIISKFIYFVFALFIVKRLKTTPLIKETKVNLMIAIILFLLHYFMQNMIMIYTALYIKNEEIVIAYIFFLITLIILFFVMTYITSLFQTREAYNNLIQIKKNNKVTQELYQELKIIRHDLKHLFLNLSYLIKNKEYDRALDIIDNKNEYLNEIPALAITYSDLFNVLFNKLLVDAHSLAIKVEYSINIDNQKILLNPDYLNLFANIFENAIENTESNGLIKIRIIQEYNLLHIEMSNTTNNKTTISKKGKEHGLGLISVKRIVKKYNGIFKNEFYDDSYVVQITLEDK